MTSGLESITRAVVENLRQTWLYKAIEDWSRKDAFEIREELNLESFSITSSDSIEMYQTIKKHLLSKTFHDDDTLQFLMEAPRWAGFTISKDGFQSGQQVIGAARDDVISLLWLMAIPKLIISPTSLPEEYPIGEIRHFVRSLISSDETRNSLVEYISYAMETRGIPDIVFKPNPIGRGYTIDEAMRAQRLQSFLAMVIMRATGFPYNLDQIFTLNEEEIIVETTAFIVSMQAKTMLKNQITGGGVRRLFDWPLIGNPKVCNRLFLTLDILSQNAIRMTMCPTFSTEMAGERTPWNLQDFISYLLQELIDHYIEIQRTRYGKNKNPELGLFISLLTGENIEIAERLLAAEDQGVALFEELNDYKRKAKIGEQPRITPERRFRVILSSLKHRVSADRLEEITSDEVIDQIIEAFDSIVEIVGGHKDSLGEESERFAQALCFETAYRILQLLKVGDTLMDLPWVSRFIAEESARLDISSGDINNLSDEYRIRRMVSAYAGGLAYLILQSSRYKSHLH